MSLLELAVSAPGDGCGDPDYPFSSLARFGAVYFDKISVTTTD